ncbi:aconitase X catalytic domain-containing protein [Kribbella yunnanensis]|uniref:Aconitase X catalytic domain-containing protein n=1 Tax=Kribbella yunnanensis TaxID=190194 RepID=A0ABP4TFI3_9ACTN
MAEIALTTEERELLAGAGGPAVALAMRLITGLAHTLGARSLIPITSAHVDGCLHHGQAGLDFAERLVALGGQVAVPTTLNVGSLDLLHPGLVRLAGTERRDARRLMDAYTALGAAPTWTCAPYQDTQRPAFGEHIAWAESNAIAFANSVLGARTDRYGDFVDICAGLTGRAPYAGLHLDENRRARIELDLSPLPAHTLRLAAAWAALGHLAGKLASDRVPMLTGCPESVPEDHLKAFGAAAASRGGIGLFHVVGTTPEAATESDATQGVPVEEVHRITPAILRAARDELSSPNPGRLDAVSLGTPHLSITEFAELAALVRAGPPMSPTVEVWAATNRTTAKVAESNGWLADLQSAGIRVLVDTCTYVTSVLNPQTRHVMTNSAKWAWYAPVNLGVAVTFGSLPDCLTSARTGTVTRDNTSWH